MNYNTSSNSLELPRTRQSLKAISESIRLVESFPGSLLKSLKVLQTIFQELSSQSNTQVYDTLRIVYKSLLVSSSADERMVFFKHVLMQVEQAELKPDALKVFIQFDSDKDIVSQAAHAYIQHRLTDFNDPFAAVTDILTLLGKNALANRGAVFAALVCFGDRRVCALARTQLNSITPADAQEFALAVSGPLHVATFEFCLGWIVQLAEDKNFEMMVPVTSALSVLVVKDSTLLCCNDEYHFGPYGFSSVTSNPVIKFSEMLAEFRPILDFLSSLHMTPLDRMIEIFNEPGSLTMSQLERRREESRRLKHERRASDRRIVEIGSKTERRTIGRRAEVRRIANRR